MLCLSKISSAKIRFFAHIGIIIKVQYANFTDFLPYIK